VRPFNTLNVLEEANDESNSGRYPLAAEKGAEMTKADAYTEIYLWNLNMDRLVRVLERLEPHAICSQRELKAYRIRLEEIRAGPNGDFAETIAVRERADEFRYRYWRTALEKQRQRAN
jgi:hypothetical protein